MTLEMNGGKEQSKEWLGAGSDKILQRTVVDGAIFGGRARRSGGSLAHRLCMRVEGTIVDPFPPLARMEAD
jgi:hypothetical protein